MSRFNIANLPRMEVAALSEQLLAMKSPDNTIAVIDVRDGDHVGGHIKGSRWVPSHQFDEWLPTLLRQLEDTKTVVFHCALSKQRGPSAALRYIREREERYGAESPVVQKVCVLRGGFSRWQESHGPDERLTEAYVKDLWEDY
ncbi:Rhodanese-like domain-containing protein [Coniella lustricola]|uniref:Rhodanese-like domain-containing protein n=1 Tax=Coniella lustricola TaxID=2025994 RepID=A0A2T3A394_9PEZI|nr:Rhodanese-like domain-containing protein [Coniella lustricola]